MRAVEVYAVSFRCATVLPFAVENDRQGKPTTLVPPFAVYNGKANAVTQATFMGMDAHYSACGLRAHPRMKCSKELARDHKQIC